jgi:hypothetical protein
MVHTHRAQKKFIARWMDFREQSSQGRGAGSNNQSAAERFLSTLRVKVAPHKQISTPSEKPQKKQ